MKEKTLRVLLVEDDEEDFLIARDLFEEIQHHRYELDWIEFYDEAIEEIERQRHDIYLLDYHLGARDGLELLVEAISRGCRRPMIMLTGQGGRQVDLEAMRAGAYDYLVKGQITPQVLERSIRYAIEHAKSTDALRETVRVSSALLTVVNNLDEGVVITDPLAEDNPIVYVNERYAEMTGYDRADLLGRNARILQGSQTEPVEIRSMREALERGDSYHGVVTNHRADGSPFKQRISIHPVRDKSGVVVQHVSICEEI
mgnify:FL=1|jgi:PAS domain S-box-containing protein